MKPFKLIQGSSHNISKFEEDVAQAIEDGYEISGEMVSEVIEKSNMPEILFFQPMVFTEEHLDFEDEDLDYSSNEEET